jgi:hypothetical protein
VQKRAPATRLDPHCGQAACASGVPQFEQNLPVDSFLQLEIS